MQITNVHIFEIDVIFDPETSPHVTLTGDVTIGHDRKRTITIGKHPPGIPQGVHLLRFQLVADDAASFPSSPIEWKSADGTFAQPPDSILHWQSPRQFGMVIFNALGFKDTFHFDVVVSYRGELYTTDPTIICDPPGLIPGCPPAPPPGKALRRAAATRPAAARAKRNTAAP